MTDVLDQDEIDNTERRPKGNIFGTVMHRAFELLMARIMVTRNIADVTDKEVRAVAANAVSDNLMDIKKAFPDYVAAVDSFGEYLLQVLQKFLRDEEIGRLLAVTECYWTEYDFSYWTDIRELSDAYNVLKPYLDKKKITVAEDQKICITGMVDLLLKTNDGKLHIIDYKSDSKGAESDEEFANHLKKYDGQLALYRIAMSAVFDVPFEDVSAELYSLYR